MVLCPNSQRTRHCVPESSGAAARSISTGEDAGVILFEGPAPERFLQGIGTGEDDFSTWFRASLTEAHGIDMSVPPPGSRACDVFVLQGEGAELPRLATRDGR